MTGRAQIVAGGYMVYPHLRLYIQQRGLRFCAALVQVPANQLTLSNDQQPRPTAQATMSSQSASHESAVYLAYIVLSCELTGLQICMACELTGPQICMSCELTGGP